jgi:hypothetical protein
VNTPLPWHNRGNNEIELKLLDNIVEMTARVARVAWVAGLARVARVARVAWVAGLARVARVARVAWVAGLQ